MPDLNDLDHFDEGLPVNPLPASEVRRRGDRRRRRNTVLATVGGVAAAAVFIGVPVALVSAQDRDDGVQPAPPAQSSSDASDDQWLQSVPDDFPLADGFPETNGDGSPTEVTDASGLAPEGVCSPFDWKLAFASDVRGISYRGETENRGGRSIAVVEDEEAARDGLAAVGMSLCDGRDDFPYLPSDLAVESQPLEIDLGTEDSYGFFERIRAADGSLSDLRVILVARTGNALYVTSSLGAAAGDQQVDFEANRLKEESARALEAMCMFAAEPCEITSTQATEPAPDPPSSAPTSEPPSPGPPSDALADFPLAMGLPEKNATDLSPVKVTGKPGVGPVELCGAVAWDPYVGSNDLIGVEFNEVEFRIARTLAVYPSVSAATDALENAAAALSACPVQEAPDAESGGPLANDRFEVGLGDQSFGWVHRSQGPVRNVSYGFAVYHLVRVGNAIYASYQASEGGRPGDDLSGETDSVTEQTRPIVEAMRDL